MYSLIKQPFAPIATAVVLSLSLPSTPVFADVFNAGALPQATAFTQAVAHLGSFADVFDFQLTAAADVSGSVSLLNLDLGTLSVLHIDNPVLSLFSAVNPVTPIATGTGAFMVPNLAPGNYEYHFSGYANGLSGGNYLFGLYSSVASPVPEPGEWALMLAGLAVVGAVARRQAGVSRRE